MLREQEGREASPTAAIIDVDRRPSQSHVQAICNGLILLADLLYRVAFYRRRQKATLTARFFSTINRLSLAVPWSCIGRRSTSTGLKVFGKGEWRLEKHGGQARRSWRKLHLAVDPNTGEILASELTTTQDGDASLVGPLLDQIAHPIGTVLADGAYDGEPVYRAVAAHSPEAQVIIPPRSTAVPSATADPVPSQRDRHIQKIAERGRLGWLRDLRYGRRSLGEVAMMRYKQVIGRGLRARSLPTQKVEAAIACKVMNIMTSFGMPVSSKRA